MSHSYIVTFSCISENSSKCLFYLTSLVNLPLFRKAFSFRKLLLVVMYSICWGRLVNLYFSMQIFRIFLLLGMLAVVCLTHLWVYLAKHLLPFTSIIERKLVFNITWYISVLIHMSTFWAMVAWQVDIAILYNNFDGGCCFIGSWSN